MLDSQRKNKIKPIAFLGYSELGQQIKNLSPENMGTVIAYDDNLIFDNKYYFPFNEYKKNICEYRWVIGLGYKHLPTKVRILNAILKSKGDFISILHKTCFISDSASIESGVVTYPMCNIDKGVTLRTGVILNNSVIISHNSFIDIGSYLSPGVNLSGNVKIGKGCFLGTGTIVSDSIKIGDNVVIGPGTVVTKNVPSNSVLIGNPMKFLNKKLNFL